MPNLSEVAAPFRSDVQDIPRSPRLSEAPVRPTDMRADSDWDAAARALIAERETLSPPRSGETSTPSELEREIARLKAEANSYQANDPDGGIDRALPDIEPFVLPPRARN